MSDPLAQQKAEARAAGYSWDEINQHLANKREIAKNAGYTDEEIDRFLGARDPKPMMDGMKAAAKENVALNAPAEGAERPKFDTNWDAFKTGLHASSAGVIATGSLPKEVAAEDMTTAQRLARLTGESVVGDFPASVVGAIAGGAIGSAAGPVGTMTGAAIGAGVGGFALPEWIKSVYRDGLENGSFSGPWDYATRQAAIWWKTAKAGITGASVVGAGAAAKIITHGSKPLVQGVSTTAAELAAMVGVSKGLEGELPHPQDIMDAGIILAGFKGATRSAEFVTHTSKNLMDNWVKTGEKPLDAAQRAVNDPYFRQQMQTPPPEPAAPGSSVTKTDAGDFVIGKVEKPKPEPEVEPKAKETTGKETGVDPTGEVDPWKVVSSRMADADAAPSMWTKLKENAEQFYMEMFKPEHPVSKLRAAIEEGGPLPDAKNPDFLNRLAETMPGIRARNAIDGQGVISYDGKVRGESIAEILKPFEGEKGPRNIWTYSIAKWALEKAEQAKETGVDVDAARRVVAEGRQKYDRAHEKLMAWQNAQIDFLVDTGVMSPEVAAKIKADNKARIPGYRWEEDGNAKGPGPGRVAFNPVKTFYGSERKIENVQQSLLRDAFTRFAVGERAVFVRETADAAAELGMARKLPGKPVKFELSDAELQKLGSEMQEGDPNTAIWRVLNRQVKENEVPVLRDGKLEVWKFDDPNLLKYLRGHDKASLSVVQKMTARIAAFQRGMIVLNPAFPVKMMMYDVPFQFIVSPGYRNTMADLVVGIGHSVGRSKEFNEFLRSPAADKIFDNLNRDEYIRDVLKGQGDPTFLEGVWNRVKTPYHALQFWASHLNYMLKAGRYIRGRRQGESEMVAGIESSEFATPRPGYGGPQARLINAVQPFFTAYLNGLEKTAKSMFGIGKTLSGKDYEASQFFIKGAMTVTSLALTAWALHKDEDWYKAVPDWQKYNGIHIPIGTMPNKDNPNAGGAAFFIPFPPIISTIFAGIPIMLMEGFVQGDAPRAKAVASALLGGVLPPGVGLSSNVALPVIEHMTNYSFFRDQPLVPQAVKDNVLAPEEFNRFSTETAKGIANFLGDLPLVKDFNLSAPIIDNYIRGWTGTLGSAAIEFSEKALLATGVREWKGDPADKITEMPLIRSFFARYPSASAKPIQTFMDRFKHYDEVHGSMKRAMEEGNFERFKKLVQENPVAAGAHTWSLRGARGLLAASTPDIGKYMDLLEVAALQVQSNPNDVRIFLEANDAMKKARDLAYIVGAFETPARREAIENIAPTGIQGPLTALDKRQILDRIYAHMQVIAERGNDAMNRLGMK